MLLSLSPEHKVGNTNKRYCQVNAQRNSDYDDEKDVNRNGDKKRRKLYQNYDRQSHFE